MLVACGLGLAWASAVPMWGAAHSRPRRVVELTPWEQAMKARDEFEAQPAGTHTKLGYTETMDGFRSIYHDNPRDRHAADAVYAVAGLLAEQGRELDDAASLKSAVGQYEFLRVQYPGSPLRRKAAEAADEARGALEAVGTEATLNATKEHKGHGASTEVHGEVSGAEAVPFDVEPVAEARTPTAKLGRGAAGPQSGLPQVTGIRHWSTPTYTRVAIDLGDEVTFQAARVPNPDRIYFDLHGARLGAELVGKSFSVTDDGFLKRIRAAQASPNVTRVVLDVNDVTDYSAFLLPNPYRLIIDIHGSKSRENTAPKNELETVSATPVAAADSVRASAAANSSGLPAMAPTDGGAAVKTVVSAAAWSAGSSENGRALNAAIGAPTHTSEAKHGTPGSMPAAKLVPNTVAVKAPATTTEVAAVSDAPGKVEATLLPSSKPIAAMVPVARDVNLGTLAAPNPTMRAGRRKRDRAAGVLIAGEAAPAKAAERTADGQTSMIRALGLKIGRIVIDAGHGGHDSGTLGANGIEEKDVVLDVALRVGRLLHDRLGAEIIYTRSDDTFIPLETRTAIANKAQADLFLSIHANSSQDETARGIETYYLNFTSDPGALDVAARENAVGGQSIHQLSDLVKKITLKDKIAESREFAADVEGSLYAGLAKGNDGLKNRGVKKAPFVVLIGANMPSILAEISFVTNPKDALQLRQPEYRERVAESLYKGVAKYESGLAGARAPMTQASTE